MRKHLKTKELLMAMTLLVSPINSYANSTSGEISITANVEPSCTISSGAAASIGEYSLINDIDLTTQIYVTCTNGVEYNIGLDAGENSSDVTDRKASSGGVFLSYQLYLDDSYNQIWGNTVGTDTQLVEGTGVSQPHTIFTRIPTSQPVPPTVGTYTDTVNITVSYE